MAKAAAAAQQSAYYCVHAKLGHVLLALPHASMRSSARRSAASTWLRTEMPNRCVPAADVQVHIGQRYQPGPTHAGRWATRLSRLVAARSPSASSGCGIAAQRLQSLRAASTDLTGTTWSPVPAVSRSAQRARPGSSACAFSSFQKDLVRQAGRRWPLYLPQRLAPPPQGPGPSSKTCCATGRRSLCARRRRSRRNGGAGCERRDWLPVNKLGGAITRHRYTLRRSRGVSWRKTEINGGLGRRKKRLFGVRLPGTAPARHS